MRRYVISENGLIMQSDGQPCTLSRIDAQHISVTHIYPHVETFRLDENDAVKVLIQYSCHCWTCGWEDALHAGQVKIMDATRPRAFDPVRHDASVHLSNLMRDLPQNRIYVTRSDRNYGCYNATLPDENGHFYTAYFTLKRDKGRFNGIRHQFHLIVESAYPRVQQEAGMKTSFRAIVGKAREGKMVKYRP
jgi:hypothetical protein